VAYCDIHAKWVITKQRITELQNTRHPINPVRPWTNLIEGRLLL
jgi:hypothetical protein